MIKLYHADVFIPAALRAQAERTTFRTLTWSRHAQLELFNDKYGMIPVKQVPHHFSAIEWVLVELEVTEEKITKYVVRRPVDTWRSLVIVLRPACCGRATVVTAWTNRTDDKHASLDRTKYEPDHGAAQDKLWETHGID